jgi:hypothetical protein
MSKALKQIFHAKQPFSIFHARSRIRGAAAEAYQLAVPGLNTAFRAVKGPKDNGKSLTVAAATYFHEI